MIKRISKHIKWKIKYHGTGIRTKNIGRDVCFGINVNLAKSSEIWGGYIGNYTYVMEYTCIDNATIGKFCSIGRNVCIGCWMHDYRKISDSPRLYREILDTQYDDTNHSVCIGNDVWIGDYAVIIKGNIGDGAVIGAGAIVTGDVPPYAIVAGNPARVVGYRFEGAMIQKLCDGKWWDWEIDKIKRNSEFFVNGGEIKE